MADVARTVYNPPVGRRAGAGLTEADPAELCDLSTVAQVKERLWKLFLPAVYGEEHPRWDATQAVGWLTFLAGAMHHSGDATDSERYRRPIDLCWWELRSSAPPALIGITVGTLCGLAVALAAYRGSNVGVGYGIGLGAGIGLALAIGLPLRWLRRSSGRSSTGRTRGMLPGVAGGVLGGILGGLMAGIAGLFGVGHALGLVEGTSAGFAVGIVAGLATDDLVSGLVGALGGGLLAGLLVGVGTGLPAAIVDGLGVGVGAGLVVSVKREHPLGTANGAVPDASAITAPGPTIAAGRAARPAAWPQPVRDLRLSWWPGLGSGFAAALAFGLPAWRLAGLTAGLGVGIVAGVIIGLVGALASKPEDLTIARGPLAVLARDRRAFAVMGLVAGLATGLATTVVVALDVGVEKHEHASLQLFFVNLRSSLGAGAVVGVFYGLVSAFVQTAWGAYCIARCWHALRGRLPWRLKAFLADTHENRHVLRQNGANYQFRHLELQRHLIVSAESEQDRLP
jgi:hypothetical protein